MEDNGRIILHENDIDKRYTRDTAGNCLWYAPIAGSDPCYTANGGLFAAPVYTQGVDCK